MQLSWSSYRLILRGKSGLQRAECQLTAGERELMESTTENIPPKGKGEKVR